MTAAKETYVSLLGKLGVDEVPEGMSTARMAKKIEHRMVKKGPPADLTAEEKALLEELEIEMGTGTPASAPAAGKTEPKEHKAAAPAAGKTEPKEHKAAAPGKAEGKPPAAKADGKKGMDKPKASKPAKDKPTKTVNRTATSPVMEAFKAFCTSHKVISRTELIKTVSKETKAPPATISNYISWAKQVKPKKGNPFGFTLVEEKDKDGNKMLHKTPAK